MGSTPIGRSMWRGMFFSPTIPKLKEELAMSHDLDELIFGSDCGTVVSSR